MTTNFEESRGILRPRAGAEKFQLSRRMPTQDLRFFIDRYWIVRWDLRSQEPYVQDVLPYPCVHAVFEQNASRVYGVDTGRFSRLLEGKGIVFAIKFRPGAFYAFVKIPVSRFTNRTISFFEAFNVQSDELEDALLAQGDEGEMVVTAEQFLRKRLPGQDENITLVNQIIDTIVAQQTITKVDNLVEQLSINKRTLQRLFQQYVGVSPKWVIQRYRLHEVAEQLNSGAAIDWTELAVDLGYFDQAHLIKDFKMLVGKTPTEYVKQIGQDLSRPTPTRRV